MNEYELTIDPEDCCKHNNLHAFLVYFDQTNDIQNCLVSSPLFHLPSLCEYFISQCDNINENEACETTALCNAAYSGCKEITELFISHGAKVDVRDCDNLIPLHYAAKTNSKENVEVLILHNSDVNSKTYFNEWTPIHYAAITNNMEIVELLISNGADVTAKDVNGNTVLHLSLIHI